MSDEGSSRRVASVPGPARRDLRGAKHDDRRTIAVIGGGWAGCAAAVELARGGFRVDLHEAAPALGGRARTVVRDGLPLDNGEHLLLGAYSDTLALASLLHEGGRESPWIAMPFAIRPFGAAQRNAVTLRARNVAPPLGLLLAVLGTRGLVWRDRIAAVRWFARQRSAGFRCREDATVAELLDDLPPRVRDDVWAPLCVAALNTPPQRASAQVFLNVLREAFAGGTHAAQTVVPRHGLAAAIPERAAQWLAARGHSVHTSSRARIAGIGDGVRIAHGIRESRADAVIVAVGPHQLETAFDAPAAAHGPRIEAAVRCVDAFEWEPITTVYLGYAAAVALPPGLTRLDDAPGQWAFDRGEILARAAPSPSRPPVRALLSIVISAHGSSGALEHSALAAAVDAQLRRLRPDLPASCWSQVIAERRATYACVPRLVRPVCGRLADRVYLAGDYTYAEFPATLEAAVRSGLRAARALMRDLGSDVTSAAADRAPAGAGASR